MRRSCHWNKGGFLVVALAVGWMPCATRAYFSDDFSGGLQGWTVAGNVSGAQQQAGLSDSGAPLAYMHQAIPLNPGIYRIAMDVKNDLSDAVPGGALPDVFFASVYFADDPNSFDLLSNTADGAVGLFDLSPTGFSLVKGGVGASSKGAEWARYSGVFDLAYAYAIPVFELNEENHLAGDSSVYLDNLSVVLIPESRTAAYAVLGIAILLWRRLRGNARVC